jgi:hypothetical protein
MAKLVSLFEIYFVFVFRHLEALREFYCTKIGQKVEKWL